MRRYASREGHARGRALSWRRRLCNGCLVHEGVAGPGYELIGATVDGPPPLGRIHVPLTGGLSILFGINGAGKTRILNALRGALLGSPTPGATDAILHMRIFDAERDIQGSFLAAVTNAARATLAADLEDGAPEWLKPAEHGGSIGWVDIVNQTAESSASWLDESARDDIAYHGFFSCHAVGTPAAPAWEVFVASPELEVKRGDEVIALHGNDRALTRELLRMHEEFTETQSNALAKAMIELGISANLFIGFTGPRFRALRNGSTAVVDAHWETSNPWPEWLPLPLWSCGKVTQPPVRVWSESINADDLARLAVEGLLAERPDDARHVLSMADADELALDEGFAGAVRELEKRALTLLRSVLPDGPDLRLDMRHPESWLRGDGPQWLALDKAMERWVALDDLSTAHRRWAGLAIDLALSEIGRRRGAQLPFVAIADEPESGLHRRVESRLANGLSELGRDLNAAMLVATHSPPLLNERQATLHHVTRSELTGESVLAPVTLDFQARLALSESATRLGVDVIDLLQLLRTALVVEGEHDDIVLRHLLADALQEGGCWVLPLRGASNAPSLSDAQLLFDVTTAHVLVLLDNLDNAGVQQRWQEAQAYLANSQSEQARHVIGRVADRAGAEGAWLAELGNRAIARGSLSRIHPWGLSEPDVIMYLPVKDFVSTGESWSALYAAYKADTVWRTQAVRGRSATAGRRTDFKSWLKSQRHATLTKATIETSAARMSDIPDEFSRLALRLLELGAFPADRPVG